MKIDKETILATARLASLEIGKKEIEKYLKEFNAIVEYVDKLGKADTSKVKPTSHVTEVGTPFRKDKIEPGLKREQALKNCPSAENSFFTVPKFIEQ